MLAYIIGGIVFLGAMAGLYYKVHHDGYEQGVGEIKTEWNAANEKARAEEAAKSAAAAKALEEANAKRTIVYKTITQTVDRYIDRPIYANACFDADGLRDANRALSGTLTDPAKPDGTMPPAKPPA